MDKEDPFSDSLLARWQSRLFKPAIYPGFPFRPCGWVALAFNRDAAGDLRLPSEVWSRLIESIRATTNEQSALIVSPQPIVGGTVATQPQPFVVALELVQIEGHFQSPLVYLPEFFMAGASERWAIWGDSDMTVVGGQVAIMLPVLDQFGAADDLVERMARDFRLTGSPEDAGMWAYIRSLVAAR